jgi:hypothetical protein
MSNGTGYNAPRGLIPRQYLNGSLYTGQTSPYNIISGLAANIATGDPVYWDNATGGITLATAGSTHRILGSFQGVRYTDTSGTVQFLPNWASGTATLGSIPAQAFITDDPFILYDIQVASGAGGTVAAPSILIGNLGLNMNLNVAQGTAYNAVAGVVPASNPAAGTPLNGQSVWYLDSNVAPAADATYQVTLIRFTPVSGNISGLVFNNVLCLINIHAFRAGVAGF